jgi:hypothetical protein
MKHVTNKMPDITLWRLVFLTQTITGRRKAKGKEEKG